MLVSAFFLWFASLSSALQDNKLSKNTNSPTTLLAYTAYLLDYDAFGEEHLLTAPGCRSASKGPCTFGEFFDECIMWFNHEGGYIPKTKIWVEKYEPGHPEAQTFSPDYALLSKLQIEAKLHPQVDSEKLFPHLYYDDQIPGGVKFTNELVKAIDLSVEKLKGAGGLNEDQQKRFKDSIRFLEDLEQARRDENEESVRKNMYDKGWRIQHPDIPIIPEPGQDVLPPWPKDITSEQIAEVQKWLDEWDNWFDRWAELDEMGMATKAQNSAVRHHRVTIACQEGIRQLKSRLASGLGPAAPGGSC